MKRIFGTMIMSVCLMASGAAQAQSVERGLTSDCAGVYTKLLSNFANTMEAGRALGLALDDSNPVTIVSTRDLVPGSYSIPRLVRVQAQNKNGDLITISMKTKGDYFCSDERIISVRAD